MTLTYKLDLKIWKMYLRT